MIKDTIPHKLPKGWVWTTLEELGIIVSGGTPSTDEPQFWGDEISWITPADLSEYKGKFISKGRRNISQIGLDNSSAVLLPKGSLLFSSRAPIGYVVIAQNEVATNQGFKNLIPTESTYTDYLYYYLLSAKQLAINMASGTTFLELSGANFKKIPVPLAPLNEQYNIVSRIEELFGELDAAKESLEKAQKMLVVYRHLILKDAFEGKLTNVKVKNGNLPISWKWVRFNDFCKLQRGYDLSISKLVKGNYPVVTSSGVNGYHNEFRANGPCLITGRSGNVGNVVFFETEKYWPHNTVLFVKDFCNNFPKFVYYFFLQLDFKSFSSSTAVPSLDRKKLYDKLVPLPELNEQIKIVQEIEYRLTIAENLGKTIKENLKEISVLRHGILKKTFQGKLVKQDSGDESSEILLRKISKEKEVILLNQKAILKIKPKFKKFMEEKRTILQIIESADKPMSAKDVWLQSEHKGNIESFYSALKKIQDKIIEVKEKSESILTLKNEDR
ncbi:MAG: restriction endonuclease subunit S [Bacteroidota bacterium]|nr:restriction endonuclease subunit S [Bacteroidota bacterium]